MPLSPSAHSIVHGRDSLLDGLRGWRQGDGESRRRTLETLGFRVGVLARRRGVPEVAPQVLARVTTEIASLPQEPLVWILSLLDAAARKAGGGEREERGGDLARLSPEEAVALAALANRVSPLLSSLPGEGGAWLRAAYAPGDSGGWRDRISATKGAPTPSLATLEAFRELHHRLGKRGEEGPACFDPTAEARLVLYDSGRLERDEVRKMDLHILACASCVAELTGAEELSGALRWLCRSPSVPKRRVGMASPTAVTIAPLPSRLPPPSLPVGPPASPVVLSPRESSPPRKGVEPPSSSGQGSGFKAEKRMKVGMQGLQDFWRWSRDSGVLSLRRGLILASLLGLMLLALWYRPTGQPDSSAVTPPPRQSSLAPRVHPPVPLFPVGEVPAGPLRMQFRPVEGAEAYRLTVWSKEGRRVRSRRMSKLSLTSPSPGKEVGTSPGKRPRQQEPVFIELSGDPLGAGNYQWQVVAELDDGRELPSPLIPFRIP